MCRNSGLKCKENTPVLEVFIVLSSFKGGTSELRVCTEGKTEREENRSESEREPRLVAVLISPFGAKCVSPGRGLSVLERPTRNQVSPPISSPRFHSGTGHAHTHIHTHNDHEGAKQTTVVYLLDAEWTCKKTHTPQGP